MPHSVSQWPWGKAFTCGPRTLLNGHHVIGDSCQENVSLHTTKHRPLSHISGPKATTEPVEGQADEVYTECANCLPTRGLSRASYLERPVWWGCFSGPLPGVPA